MNERMHTTPYCTFMLKDCRNGMGFGMGCDAVCKSYAIDLIEEAFVPAGTGWHKPEDLM